MTTGGRRLLRDGSPRLGDESRDEGLEDRDDLGLAGAPSAVSGGYGERPYARTEEFLGKFSKV